MSSDHLTSQCNRDGPWIREAGGTAHSPGDQSRCSSCGTHGAQAMLRHSNGVPEHS